MEFKISISPKKIVKKEIITFSKKKSGSFRENFDSNKLPEVLQEFLRKQNIHLSNEELQKLLREGKIERKFGTINSQVLQKSEFPLTNHELGKDFFLGDTTSIFQKEKRFLPDKKTESDIVERNLKLILVLISIFLIVLLILFLNR